MPNILKPKRGKKSTAIASNIKLENGEIFFEMPESGVGKGAGSIKFGDGVTLYRDLPYFFDKSSLSPLVHEHAIADIIDLPETLTSITDDISGIKDGTIAVGEAENAANLGNVPARNYVTLNDVQFLTNKTINGYYINTAAGKEVDENTLIPNSTSLPTSKAVASYVTTEMGKIVQIRFEVVDVLPTTGQDGIIYLVPHASGGDVYDEYIWIKDKGLYERIGSTDVDLSNYSLIGHTHKYSDLTNLPVIPSADNETIIQDSTGKLSGSKVRVLNVDPDDPNIGDMWVLSL